MKVLAAGCASGILIIGEPRTFAGSIDIELSLQILAIAQQRVQAGHVAARAINNPRDPDVVFLKACPLDPVMSSFVFAVGGTARDVRNTTLRDIRLT